MSEAITEKKEVSSGGGRPAVIVSNDKNNAKSNTVEVVYMTTKPKTDLPTHVYIESALRPSTLLCEQISTVSEGRIGEWIGELTDDEAKELDVALAISLGMKCRLGQADADTLERLNDLQMDQFCQNLYKAGHADGMKDAEGLTESEVRDVILGVKGIGPKKAGDIVKALTEAQKERS